ncbi:hypothetical protein IPU70_15860 [Achromobacter sp. SD115]|uniref:hypothetical protein n=1 Tax=Achromobacter sp. SD115 TaxID=2782011 RepID=UPI001A956C74|nr:hypothetical protein [Achromobacter sp. SD115]MBO1015037.1 hypothetical protein [Achromobacter sp. SD115]
MPFVITRKFAVSPSAGLSNFVENDFTTAMFPHPESATTTTIQASRKYTIPILFPHDRADQTPALCGRPGASDNIITTNIFLIQNKTLLDVLHLEFEAVSVMTDDLDALIAQVLADGEAIALLG